MSSLRTVEAVPASLIAPLIEKFITEEGFYDQETFKVDDGKSNFDNAYRSKEILGSLADKAGISRRTLWSYRTGVIESMHFNRADCLLCAMDMVWAWYSEPLREYYDRANAGLCIRGHGPDQQVQNKRGDMMCRQCRIERAAEHREKSVERELIAA
jgi:hypothetical protein